MVVVIISLMIASLLLYAGGIAVGQYIGKHANKIVLDIATFLYGLTGFFVGMFVYSLQNIDVGSDANNIARNLFIVGLITAVIAGTGLYVGGFIALPPSKSQSSRKE